MTMCYVDLLRWRFIEGGIPTYTEDAPTCSVDCTTPGDSSITANLG